MARISYVEEKDHPELAADIAKIKGARGGLINIYKLLLHSPTVTMTWFEHIGAIRWKTKLTPRLRELAIVRVAQVAKYAYALNQHVPGIAVPDGVSLEECEALKDWRASKYFSEAERAALAYVDAMIAGPEVPDDVFNGLRKHYNEREIVELTVLVGTYLMHNRVFTALRVDVEPKKKLKAAAVPSLPIIVVEDDPFTRLIPLVLDPNASEERRDAFADFMSTDEPDFRGWCERVRQASQGLYPAEVRMVTSETEMRANLKDCVALVVESFRVEAGDLAAAGRLRVVQKFGTGLRNIDTAACAGKGVKLLTLRRRANISCAEHAFGLMLMLARKLDELDGLVTIERIKAARGAYHPYQRNHTPGGNYARLGGTRALNGATIGIIGLGEIGHEIAVRARAFDMNVLYHQRTRAPEREERELNARHVPLSTLLSESDWIVPQLPTGPGTRDLLGRTELSQIKSGACIVNVANAPIINREALIEALRAGRLGGVALDVHYSEPVPDDDELLTFDNIILTPRMAGSPRFNGLKDFEQLITGLARELAQGNAL